MPLNQSLVPISEQMKNARFVLSVADQPVVATIIEQIGEHRRRSFTGAATEQTPKSTSAEARIEIGPAVERVLRSLKPEFTYADVIAELDEIRYRFKAKDRRNAVSSVLRKLVGDGKLSLAKKGTADKPHTYRLVS